MEIIQATEQELELASNLFNQYRQFYGQESDLASAASFLSARIANKDSMFFIALNKNCEGLGFIQLYPSFSSVAMKRMWYLNDLFVSESARKMGVASLLLQHVAEYAKANDSFSVKLATAVDNAPAKALYEKSGYKKVTAFDHYVLRTDMV